MEMYEKQTLLTPGLEDAQTRILLDVLGVLGLMTLGAYVRLPLPFSPVPVTLQTFFVLVCPFLTGPRRSAAGIGLYLVLGAAGVPLSAAAPATLGYLAAFVAAPWVCVHFRQPLVGMLAATCLIYALGAGWLIGGMGLPPTHAVAVGLLPFLPGDCVKVLAAWRFVRWVR